MRLQVILDEGVRTVEVPEEVLRDGEAFFAKIDADMDGGWQMSRVWVETPDREQRCQIVADRLLGALNTDNELIAGLMAGYILSRMPGVSAVEVDTSGDMTGTVFVGVTP